MIKARKGASHFLAAIMLTSVDSPRAEFLLVALTQVVALLALNQVAGMINLDAKLTQTHRRCS
jgi:hypothetical protein